MSDKSKRCYRVSIGTVQSLSRLRSLLRAEQGGRRVTWSDTLALAARLAETEVRSRLLRRGVDPDALIDQPAATRDRSAWLDAGDYMTPDVDE